MRFLGSGSVLFPDPGTNEAIKTTDQKRSSKNATGLKR
jgi:hypothetical protein